MPGSDRKISYRTECISAVRTVVYETVCGIVVESTGMTRKEFSKHTGIPVRTLEDWEAARRTPPEYIPRLIGYQLKYEELMKETEEDNVKNH